MAKETTSEHLRAELKNLADTLEEVLSSTGEKSKTELDKLRQKARDARRNQANTQLKEIRFRIKIDDHDFATKTGHVKRFLEGGDKVKVMIMFRGREQSRPEAGIRLLQRLADEVADISVVESTPRQDGRNMTMVLAPTRKKADAMVQQRERREAARSERRAKHEVRSQRDQVRQSRSDF